MSGQTTSLPPEIAELMTVTISWEAATGTDGYGQSSFATPVSKLCWLEQRSYMEGFEMNRSQDEWPIVPTVYMYFDGDDSDARGFTFDDRFTISNYAVPQRLQPSQIIPFFGPNFDNTTPWIIAVITSPA